MTFSAMRLWLLILWGAMAVISIDLGGAIVSRATGIAYGYFAIPSALVYVAMGVSGVRRNTLLATTSGAVAVAVIDAAFGGWIAFRVGVLHLPLRTLGDAVRLALTLKMAVAAQSLIAVVSAAVTLHVSTRRKRMLL